MAQAAPLSFDIESNVTNFSRAMQLVESTAKQKAAGFVLEFTGAGRKAETALGEFGKRSGAQIGTSLAGAAKKFEGDFAKATRGVSTNLSKGIADALRPASLGAAGIAAGVAGIALAYVTVTSAISQANAQIESFIKLGDNAERAGVGAEFWQRFSEAALQAKLSVQEVEQALKSAGSAVTPKFEKPDEIRNRLSDLFETGYLGNVQSEGLNDYRRAGNNEDRIRAAVRAMQELQQAGERLAAIDLAERLFGADVAERIRSGRLEIEAISEALERQRADLITQQQVDAAREFRDRLDEAYQAIDDALHISVALEGAGRGVLNVWLSIAETTAKAATVAGSFLDKMVAAAKAARDAQPPSALQSPLASRPVQEGEGNLAADLGATAGRSARGRTLYAEPIGPQQPEMTITNPPAPPRRPLDWYTDSTSYGRGERKSGGAKPSAGESLDQVQTFINGVERSTAALKAEMDALGKNNAERLAAINLAKAQEIATQQGITLTEQQTARIRESSRAQAEYREKIEDAHEAQAAFRSIGGDFLHGIANDARNGASAIDILTSAVQRLVDRLGDRALDSLADTLFGKSSGGGGGGLLGGLLSGGGAPGALVGAGGPIEVAI